MVRHLNEIQLLLASSSNDARKILETDAMHSVVTDILRRDKNGQVITDDGYEFFRNYIRLRWPKMPVIFHTKNLPGSFLVDEYSEYLSKWENEEIKAIELEFRLSKTIRLYEAFADLSIWNRIEPRLITVQQDLLSQLSKVDDIWQLKPDYFEQLIAEILQKIGLKVLWIPGGTDQGVDIIATASDWDFLIDVKRYNPHHPVSVELVRQVYGVASAAQSQGIQKCVGGIITSSRFTSEAEIFRSSVQPRPFLRDFDWIKEQLQMYAPYIKGSV